jgi:hypothetical protein
VRSVPEARYEKRSSSWRWRVKILITLVAFFVVIVISLSVAYYIAIFLPKFQLQKLEIQRSQIQRDDRENAARADLKMQEKCAKLSKEYFESQGFTDKNMASYQCHYNKKMNKFFILIDYTVISNPDILHYKTLTDILDRKEYGIYEWHIPGDKKTWEIVPEWTILDKKGRGNTDWDNFVKQFMEG